MAQRFIRDVITGRYKWVDIPGGRTVYGRAEPRARRSDGIQVIRDMEPYKSVATGEIVSGRRQHRDMLRRHNLIEVGNEKLPPNEPPPLPSVEDTVHQALEKLNQGYRPPPLETLDDWD